MPSANSQARRLDRPDAEFVVAAMFTEDIRHIAARLEASLELTNLNYALYQVPSIHRSISTKGNDDIAYCKPNFIHQVMMDLQRPVLYLDADVIVRALPTKILQVARSGADFAIYNWIADLANDAYVPVRVHVNGGQISNRFYQFSHSIDLYDPGQLICSGAVQYYNSTVGARHILACWLNAIEQYPNVADDELLDYTFNFLVAAERAKATWLDKAHCRYPWWIHVRPIIDHPEMPAAGSASRSFSKVAGRERFNATRVKRNPPQGPFPRNCLIDVKEKCLLRMAGQSAVPVGTFENELWLADR